MNDAIIKSGPKNPFWTTSEKLPDSEYAQKSIGVAPFLRGNEVKFGAKNLKPGATANIFFDEINVNNFAQRASVINVDSSSAFSSFKLSQGIYGASSNAYAEIIGTSISDTQKLIYVNDNFLTVLVRKDPSDPIPDSMSDTEYQPEQVVYQTSGGLQNIYYAYTGSLIPQTTFTGIVKKWRKIDNSQGLLVIQPTNGLINVVAGVASSNLWNWSAPSNKIRNSIRIDANNRFMASEELRYAKNDQKFANVNTVKPYTALSSVVTSANVGNLRTIILSTNNLSRDSIGNLVGNTIYIVSGTNVGFNSAVHSISTNTQFGWTEAVLFTAMPYQPDNSTIYSVMDHTVDDVGAMYGMFHIPAYQNLRWLTGERLFTITDTATYNDNGYNMRATAKYTSMGFIDTTTNARNDVIKESIPSSLLAPSVTGTQKVNDRKFLSQTFFTPKGNEVVDGVVKNAHGVFISSVELYFKKKPTDREELFPFTVAITKVVDGIPSNEIIAERTLEPAYVVTSSAPPAKGSNLSTKFSFTDPVYLLPGTEYAIQLITESPDYEVWTAVMGDEYTDIYGNVRRVSEQPYVGNFFKSQNASQWVPILNQDLMFIINRASFSKLPATVYFNLLRNAYTMQYVEGRTSERNIFMDAVKLTSTEQQFAPTNITYELTSYLTDETQTKDMLINNEYYSFGKDTTVSSVTSKRRRFIKAANNDISVNVKVTLSTTDESVSPIINRERFGLIAIQNIVNNAGIANNLITITDGGNHANAANIQVTISAPDVGNNNATANILPTMLSSGKVNAINIINPGSGYFSTPTITFAEPVGATKNAAAIINGETDAAGGNILAKYQTKVVTLKDGFDAGDLVVRLEAIKPQGTQIAVYLKVLSAADSDPFVSKTWQRMTPVVDQSSADQATKVSLEYRHNLNNGRISYFDGRKAMPLDGTFKHFAVKIRMTAEDPTVVPSVESMTVLAVPGDGSVAGIDGGYYSGT
jgi:hypothetical protein